ncbi:MAG: MoaD/ThiS family protein [Desulfovibrionaceae bacterium]
MHIELRCFATLSRFTPANTDAFPLPEGATVSDVLQQLGIPVPEVKIIFINGVRHDPDKELHEGDRLGLFPAVGGG